MPVYTEIDFPLKPIIDQEFTDLNFQLWIYSGTRWVRKNHAAGIEEAPVDGRQYARVAGGWQPAAADEWYLGMFVSPPLQDNKGDPLREGHVYYDTVRAAEQVWDGTAWQSFYPTYEAAGKNTLIFSKHNVPILAGTLFAGAGDTDDKGESRYDWVKNTDIISVYLNGLLLMEDVDGAGPGVGDYIVTYGPTGGIQLANDLGVGEQLLIEQLAVVDDTSALQPYVRYIRNHPEAVADQPTGGHIFEPLIPYPANHLVTYEVHGGNFDPGIHVDIPVEAGVVQSVNVKSDKEFSFTVLTGSVPGTYPITIHNQERLAFGLSIEMEIMGAAFHSIWEAPAVANDFYDVGEIEIIFTHIGQHPAYDFYVEWEPGVIEHIVTAANTPYPGPLPARSAEAFVPVPPLLPILLPDPSTTAPPPVIPPPPVSAPVLGVRAKHTYDTLGKYHVKVWGTAPHLYSGQFSLIEIVAIGDCGYTKLSFSNCSKLTKAVSGICAPRGVERLFNNTHLLTEVDLRGMNFTVAGEDALKYMVSTTPKLVTLDMTGINLSAQTNLQRMFQDSNIEDVSKVPFNTLGALTDIAFAFTQSNIRTLDLSSLNVNAVISFRRVFFNMPNLVNLNLTGWQTLAAETFEEFLAYIPQLKHVDFTGFSAAKLEKAIEMLTGTPALSNNDYDQLLIAFARTVTQHRVRLDAIGHVASALTERTKLMDTYAWDVRDSTDVSHDLGSFEYDLTTAPIKEITIKVNAVGTNTDTDLLIDWGAEPLTNPGIVSTRIFRVTAPGAYTFLYSTDASKIGVTIKGKAPNITFGDSYIPASALTYTSTLTNVLAFGKLEVITYDNMFASCYKLESFISHPENKRPGVYSAVSMFQMPEKRGTTIESVLRTLDVSGLPNFSNASFTFSGLVALTSANWNTLNTEHATNINDFLSYSSIPNSNQLSSLNFNSVVTAVNAFANAVFREAGFDASRWIMPVVTDISGLFREAGYAPGIAPSILDISGITSTVLTTMAYVFSQTTMADVIRLPVLHRNRPVNISDLMYRNVTAHDINLGDMDMTALTNTVRLITKQVPGAYLTTANYDVILIKMAAMPLSNLRLMPFDFGFSKYSSTHAVTAARKTLARAQINIIDGGPV